MKLPVHQNAWNRDDDDETDVTIHYTFLPGCVATGHVGPPEYYDPGSAAEVDIIKAVTDNGEVVTLTAAETDKFINWIMENHEIDLPDPDDLRDRDIYDRSIGL